MTPEFDKNFNDSAKPGGFFYQMPAGWHYYDAGDDYIGLKGPSYSIFKMTKFLEDFAKKHKIIMNITIDGIDTKLEPR